MLQRAIFFLGFSPKNVSVRKEKFEGNLEIYKVNTLQ